MFVLALTAAVLGFAYAAIPGAVTTESIRRAVHDGFRSGWNVQVGSLLGDIAWAIIGLIGAAWLARYDAITVALGLVGAGLLLALAQQSARGVLRPHESAVAAKPGGSLRVCLAFGLANPAGVSFWSGIGASVFGRASPDARAMVVLIVAFSIGVMIWATSIVAVASWGGRRLGARVTRWVDAISAAVLAWFGVRLFWSSLERARSLALPIVRVVW